MNIMGRQVKQCTNLICNDVIINHWLNHLDNPKNISVRRERRVCTDICHIFVTFAEILVGWLNRQKILDRYAHNIIYF